MFSDASCLPNSLEILVSVFFESELLVLHDFHSMGVGCQAYSIIELGIGMPVLFLQMHEMLEHVSASLRYRNIDEYLLVVMVLNKEA